MSKLEQLKSELEKLSEAELLQIRDWLENFVEDRMKFTPEFDAAIQRSQREMRSGLQPRIRMP
jgi:hypothetical protein